MCGRYVLKSKLPELASFYNAKVSEGIEFDEIYNAAPSFDMPVVFSQEKKRVLDLYRWGLVPFWAKDENPKYNMINARAESLNEKKSYQKPFRSQRCVVPANGFYEWKKSGKRKIPHFIRFKSNKLMNFAGLYENWHNSEGKKVDSFTIITTCSNEDVLSLHDRMPVILHNEEISFWLDPENHSTRELEKLLVPYSEGELEIYPVSEKVNSPRNQGPELIKKTGTTGTLDFNS